MGAAPRGGLLPVLVAAPSGWPPASPAAARGSPPGLARFCSPPPGSPGRRFCASAGGAGSPAAPARAVLGRARPPPLGRGVPPPRRAAARLCSPRLSPPALARLRAGPLAPPARPWSRALGGRSCPLRRVPPAARAGAGAWVSRGGSPRGGSRPAARASGGRVPRPRAAGVWRAAARRPAAAGKHPQGFPVLAGK